MTQTPFERYDPQGNIDPVEQVDYTEAIEQNQANLQQELEKHNNDLLNIQMAAARGKDDALMKLAQLSPAAAQLAKPYTEAYNTRKNFEAAKHARNIIANNPNFHEKNFNIKEAEEQHFQTWHENKVDTDVRNGLLTPEQGIEFRDHSKGMQNRIRRSLLIERAKAYPGFVDQGRSKVWTIFDKEGKEIKRTYHDPRNTDYEKNQISSHIYDSYLRDFSNPNWDQAQVWKYLASKMTSHDASLTTAELTKQRKDYENLVEARTESDVTNAIKTDGGLGAQNYIFQTAAGKYAWAGKKGSMRLARLELARVAENLAKNERYSDLEKLKSAFFEDKVIFNKGKENESVNTLAAQFPEDFEPLNRVFEQADFNEIQEKRLSLKNRTNDFEAAFIKMANEKAESTTEEPWLTDADIKASIRQLRKEVPGAKVPDLIKNYVTAEDRDDNDDMEILGAIFRNQGVIYHTDMAGMSHNVELQAAQKFGKNRILGDDKGDLISRYASMEGEVGDQIDAQVNEAFNSLVGDTKDSEAMVVVRQQAKADFQRIFWEHYLGDDKGKVGLPFDQARIAALTEVRKNILAGEYKLHVVPATPDSAYIRKRSKIHAINKNNPQSYKTELFPHTFGGEDLEGDSDITELRRLQAGIPGAKIPSIYHWYAALNPRLNLDAFDVANAQLKLYEQKNGLPVKGLDKNRSLTKQYVEGLTSPIEQRFLKSRPSYGRNNRVMVLQGGGDFNDPELVIDEAL